jgi:hypothetical protein
MEQDFIMPIENTEKLDSQMKYRLIQQVTLLDSFYNSSNLSSLSVEELLSLARKLSK